MATIYEATGTITFDGGESLAALGFLNTSSSVINQAGSGRFGTSAATKISTSAITAGNLGDLPVLNSTNRICVAFDWKRTNTTSYNYLFEQAFGGIFPGGTSYTAGAYNVSIYVKGSSGGRNLEVYTAADTSFVDSQTDFWPANDASDFTRVQIEIRASSNAPSSTPIADGVVRIWTGRDDANLTLQYENTAIPIYSLTSTDGAKTFLGLRWATHGVIDNIRWSDIPCSETQPSPYAGACCSSTGAGGSRIENGTVVPVGQRTVPEGGYPPSYSACTGGGTPATASDPTDAQSMDGAAVPLAHCDITIPDGTVLRYGQTAFTSGSGNSVTARVLNFGRVTYPLADRDGNLAAQTFTLQLGDTDGTLRGYLSSSTNRYWFQKRVNAWIESAANAALSTAPRKLASGLITDYRINEDLTVDLTCSDELIGHPLAAFNRLVGRPIRKEIFPGCPEEYLGVWGAIPYGEVSDDSRVNDNPALTPVGIMPVTYVGRADTIPGLNLPENHWYAFAVSACAIKSVQSWFGSNDNPNGAGPVRMEPGTEGVDFLIPGYSGYNARFANSYVDIVGTDGVTERWTLVFARGPRGDAAAGAYSIYGPEPQVPITLNICGIESTGDGSGAVISDLALQLQHFLCYWVLPNPTYRTGSWGSVPTYTGGTAKVKTSTFTAVKDIHDARITDGYPGSWVVTQGRPAIDTLREIQVSADIRLGLNHHGQVIAHTFDDTASTAGLTTYTATSHILADSLTIEPTVNQLENSLAYDYGPEPATGRLTGVKQTITDSESVTNYDEWKAQDLTFQCIRSKAVADDVARRRLLRTSNPPVRGSFRLDLRGTDLAQGDLIRITHYAGIGSTGWTDRVLLVDQLEASPDATEFLTTVYFEDVHDILVTNAVFGPVGLEADSTAAVVGSEAAGTAYRVG